MKMVRLMTYNMLHAPGDRLDQLVSVVRAEAPDILACQEINTVEGGLELSRELGMVPVWGMANSAEDHHDGAPVFEHLLVLTRTPPEWVRVHAGDRRAMFRPVLEALFSLQGFPPFRVFVVHFRARIDPDERFLKLRELGAFLSVVAGAKGPAVAMGDFNAREVEDGLAAPRAREAPDDHLAAVHGGVYRAISGAGFADTFRLLHQERQEDESTLIKAAGAKVDYIFVNEPLVGHVSSSYIVDSDLVRTASDHRPVVTELAWE